MKSEYIENNSLINNKKKTENLQNKIMEPPQQMSLISN